MLLNSIISMRLIESSDIKRKIANDEKIINQISFAANIIIECLKNNGKIVLCGNGGSASDALHFAGEIVGRFQKERNPWPAIALNSDVSTLTAIANDYGYDSVFSRQTKAHLKENDIFIGISTSGNSKNIINALLEAKKIGAKTIVLVGKDGGELNRISDISICINSPITARIQECHITIIHIICELVESSLILHD